MRLKQQPKCSPLFIFYWRVIHTYEKDFFDEYAERYGVIVVAAVTMVLFQGMSLKVEKMDKKGNREGFLEKKSNLFDFFISIPFWIATQGIGGGVVSERNFEG